MTTTTLTKTEKTLAKSGKVRLGLAGKDLSNGEVAELLANPDFVDELRELAVAGHNCTATEPAEAELELLELELVSLAASRSNLCVKAVETDVVLTDDFTTYVAQYELTL